MKSTCSKPAKAVLFCQHVTFHPSAPCVIQQLRKVFPFDIVPSHLIFDRDSIFSTYVVAFVKSFDISPVRTAYWNPWQNGVIERWVGRCRRELLDHVIVLNERHAMKLLRGVSLPNRVFTNTSLTLVYRRYYEQETILKCRGVNPLLNRGE